MLLDYERNLIYCLKFIQTSIMADQKRISGYFVNFLQLLVITTCLALFICQMYDIYEKYAQKMTTVGIRTYSQDEETKFLPCLTVCPWQTFKTRGFYYNRKTLVQETFEKEEIFADIKGFSVFNKSEYSLEEIQSVFLGRCYTVCPVRPSRRNYGFYIFLKNSMDLKGSTFFCQNPSLVINFEPIIQK